MPRRSRIDAPGALHHIILRGIERRKIFRDDTDRDAFIDRLSTLIEETGTRCYAWALLSNHVHLLLRTGEVPLATLMRRLLTGYAQYFNRRHNRHGQLFQNRYKSILCQEETYLLELTRYIHLNPLRAKIVLDLKALERYPYAGHGVLMGKRKAPWQDTRLILGQFGRNQSTARRKYRLFVEQGAKQGRRPDLVGGGLIRSLGGWEKAKTLPRGMARQKGDERILGDGDFVERVLATCGEQLKKRYRLRALGIDVDRVVSSVADYFNVDPDLVLSPARYRPVVRARSVFCFITVRFLGETATALAKRMGLTQPAVSIAVQRGSEIVKREKIDILKLVEK